MRRKILIWHQGALGDLVLSLPALHSIRAHCRSLRIHLIARPDVSEILRSNNITDDFSSNESALFAALFVPERGVPQRLREFLAAFSSVFVFLRTPDPLFLENLKNNIPEIFLIRTSPEADCIVHVSDYQLSELRSAGIREAVPKVMLQAGHFASPIPEKIISIQPGSGGEKKCWPLDLYLELVSMLSQENKFRFCFMLGPAEGRKYEKIADFISTVKINAFILNNRTLLEISEVLKKSVVYIGNDSGITHLASALGTNTVAIFGPTDPRIWGPRWNATVIRSGYPCSPCGREGYLNCREPSCLALLNPEDVFDQVMRLLKLPQHGGSGPAPHFQ